MNPLYIGAGAVGILALLLASNASAKPVPNKDKRGDGTRKDMPANDTTDPEFEPVLTDTGLVLEWTERAKDIPVPAAPSKQRVDPPNYGVPPGTYDVTVFRTPKDIRAFFHAFGYIPLNAVTDVPMNGLGPDRKLGGGDDEPSAIVRDFQEDYNLVSRSRNLTETWGTLDEDGLVGPHTVNALQHAREQAGVPDTGLAEWWANTVASVLDPDDIPDDEETPEGPIDG